MKLSFCLITKNEEGNLPRCLKSIGTLADEIIVVDTASADATVQIARDHGARVFDEDWKGYGAQKNSAAQKASHPWIFSIDADEEISPELSTQIAAWKRIASPEPSDVWEVCRCVFFEGRWIRHGDWYPDWVLRLYHRDHTRFNDARVHESLQLTGQRRKLRGELHHYTYRNREDQLERIDKYARLWAEEKFAAGKRAGAAAPVMHSFFRFFRAYVIKHGFLDGRIGLQIALANAHEVFMKYQLLHEKGSGHGQT